MGFDELGALQRAKQMEQAQAISSEKLVLKKWSSTKENIILTVTCVLIPFTFAFSSIVGLIVLFYYQFFAKKVYVKDIATGDKFFISRDHWKQYKRHHKDNQKRTVDIFGEKTTRSEVHHASTSTPERDVSEEHVLTPTVATRSYEDPETLPSQEEIVASEEIEKIYIHSIVVGMKFDGRDKKLKKLINQLKKDDYFYEKYDNLKNKDILEESHLYSDENSPLWELEFEYLPYSTIEAEPENEFDPNAIAVYVGEYASDAFKVGYLPKEDAARIQYLINNATVLKVHTQIKGGKYKYVDFDDLGEDKVKTGTKDYMLDLEITFGK